MISPVAFLCHGSEDKDTVRVLARGLMAQGVDVFFDEWEIGPGDSIRRKLDAGIGGCTHFVAVLTAISIQKPWVNLELDAAYVRLIEGSAKFIPLRLGLAVAGLPPLMRGMRSPAIGDPEADAVRLAAFMHGVSLKPPLGNTPSAVRAAKSEVGLSPAAQAIAQLMVTHSRQGRAYDPQVSPEVLMAGCGLGLEDVVDGVDELEAIGLVKRSLALGHEHFVVASPLASLFVALDKAFGVGDPEQDARQIAADLVNSGGGGSTAQLAENYGWTPRRMNPALSYLVINRLIQASAAIDQNYIYPFVGVIPATRRFAREGNG